MNKHLFIIRTRILYVGLNTTRTADGEAHRHVLKSFLLLLLRVVQVHFDSTHCWRASHIEAHTYAYALETL